ncbi:MAG: esterase/lipase family protein [Planctomycetaceae bacterium]
MKFPSHLFPLTRLTSGGLQLWSDHIYRDGYRIQQHSLTQRWRLLDPTNHRLVAGDREPCQAALDQLRDRDEWNRIEQPFVVLLHGLMRTAYCMCKLQRWLQNAGFPQVLRFSYASTRASILDHAAALGEYVESLPCRSKLSFVGHSMGNIVLRAAIGQWTRSERGASILSRMHRVVMLGPPNQGAAIARKLAQQTRVFGLINGPGGMELGEKWGDIQDKLGIPPCPFAIVAGDRSGRLIQNPLVDGASDFFVSVHEAQLDGAAELVTLPLPHTTLMTDRLSLQYVTSFLAGCESNRTAHPRLRQ